LGKKTIQDITDVIGDDTLSFSNTDFNVLEEVVDVLEPFADVTATCQSETTATVSMVVPAIVHILHHLKQMNANVSLLKKLINQLDQSINIRFAGIIKRLLLQPILDSDPFNDPLYFVATLLDPKFKFRWIYLMNYAPSMQSKIKHAMLNLVLDECERNRNRQMNQSHSQHSSLNSNETSGQGVTNTKKRKLFQYDDDDDEGSLSTNPELSPTDELSIYLNDSNRISSLSSWKTKCPSSLTAVVKQVFSVQASSAPIERVFSQSGLVMSPGRTSMRDELFQSLVFLRVNHNLL
jgi:hAT family C-terminal dimerisation region